MDPTQVMTLLTAAGAAFMAADAWLGGRRTEGYNATVAWKRGGAFVLAAITLGYLSGVTQEITTQAAWPGNLDARAWPGLAIYTVLIVVGYGVIWPRGTLTHGRPLRPLRAVFFGLCWGLAQSLVFLTLWTWCGLLGLGPWWTAGLAYLAIGTYNGLWQALYWDVKVSPPHNIQSWNARKVALVHTPNLLFTLAWLTVYGLPGAWVVVVMQCTALVLSSWTMHFPAPGDDGAPDPQPDD